MDYQNTQTAAFFYGVFTSLHSLELDVHSRTELCPNVILIDFYVQKTFIDYPFILLSQPQK